jgi:hypothetical protein
MDDFPIDDWGGDMIDEDVAQLLDNFEDDLKPDDDDVIIVDYSIPDDNVNSNPKTAYAQLIDGIDPNKSTTDMELISLFDIPEASKQKDTVFVNGYFSDHSRLRTHSSCFILPLSLTSTDEPIFIDVYLSPQILERVLGMTVSEFMNMRQNKDGQRVIMEKSDVLASFLETYNGFVGLRRARQKHLDIWSDLIGFYEVVSLGDM